MKLIPLSKQGKNKGKYFAQVDDEDYDWLNQYNWFVIEDENTCYAKMVIRIDGKQKQIAMHNFIMGNTNKRLDVNHINFDGLCNIRSNLKIGTEQQNSVWRKKPNTPNPYSKYKGVGNSGIISKPFRARIRVNGKKVHLGNFKTEIEAAQAYDKKLNEVYGEWAYTNFQHMYK